jgi:hypothetical protein
MATRGTYEIDNRVFYCHWDNYPEGAALRFNKMLECKNGDLAHRFVRGNHDAQLTESHDIHGDTEYKYRVWRDPDGIVQIIWHSRDIDSDGWMKANIMTLSEYLESFGEQDNIQPCSPRGLLVEDAVTLQAQFMQDIGRAIMSYHYDVALARPSELLMDGWRYFKELDRGNTNGRYLSQFSDMNLGRLETLRGALESKEFMTRYLNDKVSTVSKGV